MAEPALQKAQDVPRKQAEAEKAAAAAKSKPVPECPHVLSHWVKGPNGQVRCEVLTKRRPLGKGGFAVVYEMHRTEDGRPFACKVVSKESIVKPRARQKLETEVLIHESLEHSNIVKFYDAWEDDKNVYILMELCSGKTLADVLKAKGRLSEQDAAWYLDRLLGAMRYLHDRKVIHRDLKLSNVFIDFKGDIKVGDFGLACILEYDGQRKTTICGTPNYIAPEVLGGSAVGHSYEVDIWSIGVMLYALLVGKPPFETADVKSTYKRIKANAYTFPDDCQLSSDARALIQGTLRPEPHLRPTLQDLIDHPFLARFRARTAAGSAAASVAAATAAAAAPRSPSRPLQTIPESQRLGDTGSMSQSAQPQVQQAYEAKAIPGKPSAPAPRTPNTPSPATPELASEPAARPASAAYPYRGAAVQTAAAAPTGRAQSGHPAVAAHPYPHHYLASNLSSTPTTTDSLASQYALPPSSASATHSSHTPVSYSPQPAHHHNHASSHAPAASQHRAAQPLVSPRAAMPGAHAGSSTPTRSVSGHSPLRPFHPASPLSPSLSSTASPRPSHQHAAAEAAVRARRRLDQANTPQASPGRLSSAAARHALGDASGRANSTAVDREARPMTVVSTEGLAVAAGAKSPARGASAASSGPAPTDGYAARGSSAVAAAVAAYAEAARASRLGAGRSPPSPSPSPPRRPMSRQPSGRHDENEDGALTDMHEELSKSFAFHAARLAAASSAAGARAPAAQGHLPGPASHSSTASAARSTSVPRGAVAHSGRPADPLASPQRPTSSHGGVAVTPPRGTAGLASRPMSPLGPGLSREMSSDSLAGPRGGAVEEATGCSVWIHKWIDSEKYGLAYLLSDNTVGVLFNDATKIALEPSRAHFWYMEPVKEGRAAAANGAKKREEVQRFPANYQAAPEDRDLNKKVTLLWHFDKHLRRQDGSRPALPTPAAASGPSSPSSPPIFLKKWVRAKSQALIFRLSNKAIQVAFQDGTEIVLSSGARSVSYLDRAGVRRDHRLSALPSDPELLRRLRYTKEVLNHLISNSAAGAAPGSAVGPARR